MALAGHYPVPKDAKIHQYYFEDAEFEKHHNITCNRDDRIQFWFGTQTGKSRSNDKLWFIVHNEDRMKIYMEYTDQKETSQRGIESAEAQHIHKSKRTSN